MQIELRFGDSTVMIADEFPEFGAVSPQTLGGTYGALTISTDDVDALWARALSAGAEVHAPLQDAFWGERHGQILDPFGHRWGLAQHVRDVPQDEIVRQAAAVFGGGE
jgi:PhnB protein